MQGVVRLDNLILQEHKIEYHAYLQFLNDMDHAFVYFAETSAKYYLYL